MSQISDNVEKIAAVLQSHCPSVFRAVAPKLAEILTLNEHDEKIILQLAIRTQRVVALNVAPDDHKEMHG